MSQQLIKVRPTKIELVKLKRRLSLAQRVQKIVKDKLSILTMEFLQIARETVKAREKLVESFAELYRSLSVASGYHGYMVLEKELLATESNASTVAGTRNVAGVRIPSFELTGNEKAMKRYSLIDTSAYVDRAAQSSERCLEAIMEIAELQRSLELIGKEINKAKRITNALEYITIPSLQTTIDFLNLTFEERDREEKIRLKRVKMLIEEK
jgi:V/A-type H+/Na+-transporting ATPase subunit D